MTSRLRRIFVRIAVYLFRLAYHSKLKQFENALKNPRLAQADVLKGILGQMEKTEYGRRYRIHAGMSREEFQSQVPVNDYESLEPWIQRQAQSRDELLTPAPLRIFEKTSGSRGIAKWIPYNDAQLKTFERMFILWSLDLFRSGLELESGKVYFLISPKLIRHERAPNGVSVGLEDDSGYLGSLISAVSRLFFINSSCDLTTPENFISDLSLSLLREPELEVISIWSPSLLLLVTKLIAKDRLKLASCTGLSRSTSEALRSNEEGARLHARLWPNLKLISAWDAATARADAIKVQLDFTHARFQGKGLLATEAAMTLPWSEAEGHVPLVTESYFEFVDERDGRLRDLTELEYGATYSIVVTTANGFLRYKIGDRVRACRNYYDTPTFEFLGRAVGVSDLKGEKLTPEFIETCLDGVFGDSRPFFIVTPCFENDAAFYRLAIDDSSSDLVDLARRFEAALACQHHYALARRLGQLSHVRAIFISDLREIYYQYRTRQGHQAGQIKIETLVTAPPFLEALDGAMRRSISTSRESRSVGTARL